MNLTIGQATVLMLKGSDSESLKDTLTQNFCGYVDVYKWIIYTDGRWRYMNGCIDRR